MPDESALPPNAAATDPPVGDASSPAPGPTSDNRAPAAAASRPEGSPPAPLESRLPPPGETIGTTEILDRFLDWILESGIEPYPHQEDALLELMAGKHVILSTPTGSGKSLVALGMHFKALCQGGWSVYTSPIKALASEKFFELCALFGPENVGMLTGDASINRDAPIICCTAEILSNMALRDAPDIAPPSVVMDEFHYYSDAGRGIAWQIPLLTMPDTRFLLMSATLGDTEDIRGYLRESTGQDAVEVYSEDRPVPLDYEYRETHIQETVQALLAKQKAPIYIVSFTHRDCAELAQSLTSVALCDKREKKAIRKAMRGKRFDTPYGKELRRFLSDGIAVHHAGLLPKYRLLVEQLAQQGLLKVVCGTDTLGVGVNIPIRTVLFAKLAKYDGNKVGILSARDFRQIAGRAGRKGFDDLGSIVCQAPEHVIENKKALQKASKKGKSKSRSKSPPPGTVVWSKKTFEQLQTRRPEPLVSRFRVSHGMLINVLQRETEPLGYRFLVDLVMRSHESEVRKRQILKAAAELFRALRRADIVRLRRDESGALRVEVSEELQREFALHESLSLYLVDAAAALDPTAPDYAYDLCSLVEAIQQDPRAILIQQERKIKGELIARMKAEGIPYEERMAKLEDVRHAQPLADFIHASFNAYAARHPWVRQDEVNPKSIAREMAQGYFSFSDYVKKYNLQRSEGLLLRYLSQVYKTLVQTIPESLRDEAVLDLIAYLRLTIEQVDSSLVDEWERLVGLVTGGEDAPESGLDLVHDLARQPEVLEARVRAELLSLVRALSTADWAAAARAVRQPDPEDADALLDPEGPWNADRFQRAMRPFFEEHERLVFEPHTRKRDHTRLWQVGPRRWEVTQILVDPAGDNLWHIAAEVDLSKERDAHDRLLEMRAISV